MEEGGSIKFLGREELGMAAVLKFYCLHPFLLFLFSCPLQVVCNTAAPTPPHLAMIFIEEHDLSNNLYSFIVYLVKSYVLTLFYTS